MRGQVGGSQELLATMVPLSLLSPPFSLLPQTLAMGLMTGTIARYAPGTLQ